MRASSDQSGRGRTDFGRSELSCANRHASPIRHPLGVRKYEQGGRLSAASVRGGGPFEEMASLVGSTSLPPSESLSPSESESADDDDSGSES